MRLRLRMPRPEDVWKRVGWLMAASIIATPGISIVLGRILDFVQLCMNEDIDHEPKFLQVMIVTYLLSTSVIAIYEAAYFFKKYMDSQIEKEKLEGLHAEMRLHNLRNQINPHFLFNSLNILMGLIASDSEIAMNYLGKLSRFYRYTVGQNEKQLVPLSEEIENAQLFGELLQVRFENGLKISWPESNHIHGQIIPLSLQLVIENAVKHNVCSSEQPLEIKIDISNKYISIVNNMQPKITPVESSGIGLNNIEERFGYFTDYKVRIAKNEEEFQVSLPIIDSL